MNTANIKLNEQEVITAYKDFQALLNTYKDFNQFYGRVMRMEDDLELVESIDFYTENEIKLKVLYKQEYVFEVGMICPSQQCNNNWDYIDSMWVFCDDGSTWSEFHEINLHDLVLYKEVKLKE